MLTKHLICVMAKTLGCVPNGRHLFTKLKAQQVKAWVVFKHILSTPILLLFTKVLTDGRWWMSWLLGFSKRWNTSSLIYSSRIDKTPFGVIGQYPSPARYAESWQLLSLLHYAQACVSHIMEILTDCRFNVKSSVKANYRHI